MKRIITIILILISVRSFSQEILLEQDVKADSLIPVWGPNLRNYIHGFAGFGFIVSTDKETSYIKSGVSNTFDLGIRYKRKIMNNFAMGADLGINLAAFKIKQDPGKTVPDTLINLREKFQINAAVSSVYLRFNIGRRGNYIGNYLDMGVYGSWNMMKKHRTINDNANGERVRTVTSRLKYVENFSYGLLARIGIGRWALTGRYRVSDIFKASYQMPELPQLIVGVEVGLFR